MKQSLLRRVLSVLLCVSLLLGVSVVRPQRAEAFAISASVVASVIMIMTACGVSFWASTQGDAESYISEKLGEYLDQLSPSPASILDWLGIDDLGQLFFVLSGGIVRFDSNVVNPILGFVRWFNQTEGVVSGGNPVGDLGNGISYEASLGYHLGNTTGSYAVTDAGNGAIRVDLDGFGLTNANDMVGLNILLRFPVMLNDDNYLRVEIVEGGYTSAFLKWGCWNDNFWTGNSFASNGSYLNVGIRNDAAGTPYYLQIYAGNAQTASIVFRFTNEGTSDMSTPATAVVTPSSAVSVPDDTSEDETFDVTPSVPLSEGMSVDDASSAVFDGATSSDGLTSEVEVAEGVSAGWGWLSDILNSIHDFLAGIAQTVLGIPQAISQGAQDVITGIQSLPQLISDALVNLFVPDEAYIGEFVASLHGIFDNRFSILSYPFSVLGEFITRASGIDEDEPILRWPDIYEPFSGQLLIGAGSYNLNNIRQGNFAQAHGLYMVVVKGWIAFEFLGYLYSWFCSVFKMREDDFVSPLEAYDGGDDG